MKTEFELGREYERLSSKIFRYQLMGMICLIMAPIWYFFSVWSLNIRTNGWAGLTIFGCMNLLLANRLKIEEREKGLKIEV